MPKIFYPTQEKYLTSFRKNQDHLITKLEEYAEQNHIPILDWHSAEFMENMIKVLKPERALEIGTAIGYSTIRIARCLGKKSIIYTIEKSNDNIKLAQQNFEKSGLEKKIKLIKGDALNVLPQIDKKFDFIFLDADKEDYKRLFDYSMLLLKKNGVILVDNLLWHGYAASSKVPPKYLKSTKHIREFNKIFMLQKNLESMIIPIGDGLGFGFRK